MSDTNGAAVSVGQPSEQDLLHSFEIKQQLIRDRVASVVHGYHTATYLVGRPGTSKTHTVREELERLEEPWVYQNARMTPMGLFEFIAEGHTTWRYRLAPIATGTKVTESYEYESLHGVQKLVYETLMRRPAAMVRGMQHTLERIKQSVESS